MSGYANDPGTVQQEAGFGFYNRFWTESYSDGLTALAGGGQSAKTTQLASMFNTVSTVTTPGDSVQLPPSSPGLCIGLENNTANQLQCFAQNGSSDTINGIAGSTGIPVAPYATVFFICSKAGAWYAQDAAYGAYVNGGTTNANLGTVTTQTGITAHAGGGQASAVQLTAAQCQISTCATIGDSVKLPPSQPGAQITVVNNGAASCNVFPASGEQINSGGANTAAALAAGSILIYFCFVTGNWVTH